MMQVPSGMQLMQIPTQGGGTVTVPYSMNANGEIAFSGMQLSRQGFSGAQVRQGFDATQARTPQAVKTGYFDTSNVFHDAIKGKDEYGNDVYPIPCPAGTTNVELQSDWHYASENEDLPDLATEADRGLQFIQSHRKERDPFGLYNHVIMDSGCIALLASIAALTCLGVNPSLFFRTVAILEVISSPAYPFCLFEESSKWALSASVSIVIDPTAAGDHEPTAEQNNRALKKRVRVALAQLPYKVVPKVITECLGRRAAELLNVFPQKDSISSHFSPQQLIDNVNINYKSDMVAELGQYVHAIGTDSNNSMEPRSIEAIYIEPTKGQRTGHQVLNLNTKKMISRPKVVVLPVTDQVIQRVEAWAAAEGVTSMKFFDKKRDLETFQDGNQIAGVDDTEQGYLEEAFDQDYEPEDEDERDFNLRGQFNDINDSEREELLADADNDVDDMPELTVRFQGDDDYESDDDSGDEGDEEEEPIVANLDHHQEDVDRGTDDIGSLVTDLEDLQEPPEEEIVFEPEEPQVAKVT
ncbi:unnamed protein product [Cylindrotheca closterium]|uniref:Uncharacterized protein n=1 Tax=Cylindrotheca closterium TaxID=2856 RepID=A0AAD2FV50_9STRA|nr:unnamed protein product [Cylindrotheca closterium]